MKKFLAIVFSIFYFGLSSGAVFSVHYCMDELVAVSQKITDECGTCGTHQKKGCCDSEVKILKTDQSQKADLLKLTFSESVLESVQAYFNIPTFSVSNSKFSTLKINAPPEKWSVPIFIQHCNFRI